MKIGITVKLAHRRHYCCHFASQSMIFYVHAIHPSNCFLRKLCTHRCRINPFPGLSLVLFNQIVMTEVLSFLHKTLNGLLCLFFCTKRVNIEVLDVFSFHLQIHKRIELIFSILQPIFRLLRRCLLFKFRLLALKQTDVAI